jgi:hypothetical protein
VFGFRLDFGLGGGLRHGKEYLRGNCDDKEGGRGRKRGRKEKFVVDCAMLLPICSLFVVVVK